MQPNILVLSPDGHIFHGQDCHQPCLPSPQLRIPTKPPKCNCRGLFSSWTTEHTTFITFISTECGTSNVQFLLSTWTHVATDRKFHLPLPYSLNQFLCQISACIDSQCAQNITYDLSSKDNAPQRAASVNEISPYNQLIWSRCGPNIVKVRGIPLLI